MLDMFLQHPAITAAERTGYPDGIAPEEPRCPVCGGECWEVFTTLEPLPEIIGCRECLGCYDADTCPECYRDIETQETPVCPVCDAECERIYYFIGSRASIAGCDNCLRSDDPGNYAECFMEV